MFEFEWVSMGRTQNGAGMDVAPLHSVGFLLPEMK